MIEASKRKLLYLIHVFLKIQQAEGCNRQCFQHKEQYAYPLEFGLNPYNTGLLNCLM